MGIMRPLEAVVLAPQHLARDLAPFRVGRIFVRVREAVVLDFLEVVKVRRILALVLPLVPRGPRARGVLPGLVRAHPHLSGFGEVRVLGAALLARGLQARGVRPVVGSRSTERQ